MQASIMVPNNRFNAFVLIQTTILWKIRFAG